METALARAAESGVQQMQTLLHDERNSRVAARVSGFLKYWMQLGLARAWRRWRGYAPVRGARRRRREHALRLGVRRLFGGLACRSFAYWLQALECRRKEVLQAAAEQVRACAVCVCTRARV